MIALLTDAELLELCLATTAINGIATATRDAQRVAASDWVRGQVAPRYSQFVSPLLTDTDVHGDVKLAIAGVAAYRLMSHKGYNPTKGSDDTIKAVFDDAREWLRQVRAYETEILGFEPDRGNALVGGTDSGHWENWRSKC